MGISHEHPRIPMATDRGNLWHTQPFLEEPTHGLMPKIMKP
jgi:hypothetical protein